VKKKPAPSKAAKPTAENPKDESKLDSAAAEPDANLDGAPKSAVPAAMATPSAALPASVANANAQIPVAAADGAAPGAPLATSQAMPEASPSADGQVVPPDEINDLDRAAVDSPPTMMAGSTPMPAAAAQSPTTVGAAQVSSATSNDGAWDKASLIGKIFIAAGGLLTLASAARMFMA
jgi:hypothetical protein